VGSAPDEWGDLTEQLRRASSAAGFDLVQPLQVGWYNARVAGTLQLEEYGSPTNLALVIGNTRELWPKFLNSLRTEPRLRDFPAGAGAPMAASAAPVPIQSGEPGAVGTSGRRSSVAAAVGTGGTVTPARIIQGGFATARRAENNDGIWLRFMGARWISAGPAVPLHAVAPGLGQAFALLDEESSRFYRISCKVPERPDTGRYYRVVIRVKKPDMVVSARRGRYGDVIPGSAGHQDASGRQVVDSLARYRSLPLRGAVAVLPAAGDGPARVGIVVEALGPVELPRGKGGEASLELDFIVVARAAGEIVARSDRPLRATVQPQGVAAVEKGFRLESALALPPGPYEIQANVRMERPAQFASWTTDVVVPPSAEAAGLRFDEVVLAPPPDAAPLLIQVREEGDPFAVGSQVRLLPTTAPSYPAPGGLSAMFWIRGLAVP